MPGLAQEPKKSYNRLQHVKYNEKVVTGVLKDTPWLTPFDCQKKPKVWHDMRLAMDTIYQTDCATIVSIWSRSLRQSTNGAVRQRMKRRSQERVEYKGSICEYFLVKRTPMDCIMQVTGHYYYSV